MTNTRLTNKETFYIFIKYPHKQTQSFFFFSLQMEDSQTTVQMETRPPKTLTSDPNKLPDDDALNSKLVGGVKTFNNIIT